jgi:hypothetical protein
MTASDSPSAIINAVDRQLGRAQFILSLIIIVGFLGAIAATFYYHAELTATQLTLIASLLSTLGTVFTLTANFWFARHRPQSGAPADTNPPIPTSPPQAAKPQQP